MSTSDSRLTRLPVARPTRNELWLLASGESRKLVKVYVGADAHQRCQTESSLLRYWADSGFAVPRVENGTELQFQGPYLVMSWIEASSFRDGLSDTSLPIADRLAMVKRVIDVAAQRHALALESDEMRLIRDDANTGNFLIGDKEVVHIDFERLPRSTDVLDAAAVELAKLVRWIVRDLGRDQLDPALRIAIYAYRDQPAILKRIISRTCERPGQFFHRLLDRRRKAHPGAITKYDIADGLQRLFV